VAEQEVIEAGAHAYRVSLPEGGFEGPLDLLLHLCQKHELDILNIPISLVTEKYLEYLAVMQLMNLDLAAEYLVMAATLAHIKSKMLLPAPPPGQEDSESPLEEIDPREALIRRLLEYQKYKKAGEELTARGVTGRDVFLRGVAVAEAVQVGEPPLAEIPLYRLVEAFQAVLQKAKVKITHDIVADRISITDRIHELTAILRDKRRLLFEDLFRDLTTRFDLVITFLAILEMAKLRMTRLVQVDPFSPLYIEVTMKWEDDDDGADRPLPSDISASQEEFDAAARAKEDAPEAPPPDLPAESPSEPAQAEASPNASSSPDFDADVQTAADSSPALGADVQTAAGSNPELDTDDLQAAPDSNPELGADVQTATGSSPELDADLQAAPDSNPAFDADLDAVLDPPLPDFLGQEPLAEALPPSEPAPGADFQGPHALEAQTSEPALSQPALSQPAALDLASSPESAPEPSANSEPALSQPALSQPALSQPALALDLASSPASAPEPSAPSVPELSEAAAPAAAPSAPASEPQASAAETTSAADPASDATKSAPDSDDQAEDQP
jgi:segregation and condensation protein A